MWFSIHIVIAQRSRATLSQAHFNLLAIVRATDVVVARAVRRCFTYGAVVSQETPGRPLSHLCSFLATDVHLHDVETTHISQYALTACMCTSSLFSSDS